MYTFVGWADLNHFSFPSLKKKAIEKEIPTTVMNALEIRKATQKIGDINHSVCTHALCHLSLSSQKILESSSKI